MKPQEPPFDLSLAFARQREACAAAPFPNWAERADRLQRLRRLLADHETEISRAIDEDFGGRPAIETELAEIWPSLEEVKGALRHGRRWMKPRRAGVGKWFLPARGHVLPQPLGVVGIIVPWNYPLYLGVGPVAAALAAGNRAMVKMSEFTPAFSALFQQLCAKAFSPEEVCIVTGAADVAAQFSALPFDHLLFTGSTAVGRKVMAAAAANLTPVTLELGGKSPAIVTPGYPLDHAVQRILAGKLLNAGQTCIAPDYVLLPRAALSAFVEAARAQARRGYPGGLADPHYCSIINDGQYRRLARDVDEAATRGTRIEALFDGAPRDDARRRLAPTLLVDPPVDCAAMRDEIFGPVLPLVPYDRVEDAIAFVNARPRPLALYWFDRDAARTENALQAMPAGGVTVNDTLLHIAQESLPFGGVGASGMGHYHGQWGFDTFSKLKPVFRQSRLNGMALFLPPYRPAMRRLLALMKRF
ncbi:coniferyl aldehyde dehydrogenase [Piscinibacter sp.]|uniref:coniferyl aldehyde dehydrogenase n=1 Tax=Piscinibacter sp. TaxID=1903157 RepID=UPI002CF9E850|nr:coniferyl aldehyde dehydrogenase [Albitalea sp.]HUG25677.1 coniferyl aldehyde dehydrogenase [Albitalea sp.]